MAKFQKETTPAGTRYYRVGAPSDHHETRTVMPEGFEPGEDDEIEDLTPVAPPQG